MDTVLAALQQYETVASALQRVGQIFRLCHCQLLHSTESSSAAGHHDKPIAPQL
jgi:hypothetical protein